MLPNGLRGSFLAPWRDMAGLQVRQFQAVGEQLADEFALRIYGAALFHDKHGQQYVREKKNQRQTMLPQPGSILSGGFHLR